MAKKTLTYLFKAFLVAYVFMAGAAFAADNDGDKAAPVRDHGGRTERAGTPGCRPFARAGLPLRGASAPEEHLDRPALAHQRKRERVVAAP